MEAASGRFWRWAPFAVVCADVGVFTLAHGRVPFELEYVARLAVALAALGIARAMDRRAWSVVVGPSTDRRREFRVFAHVAFGVGAATVVFAGVMTALVLWFGVPPLAVPPVDIQRDTRVVEWLFAACLFAPIQEEIVYRGFLLGPLRQVRKPVELVIISGVIFAVLHLAYGRPVMSAGYYFVAGCLFGFAYVRGGHLWIPIALHAIGNLVVAAKDLAILHGLEWIDWIPGLRFVE